MPTPWGQLLGDGLSEVVAQHAAAGGARGIGVIQGLEIVDGDAEAPELAANVSLACLDEGLIVGDLRSGLIEGNTLRLAPPLVVDGSQMQEALSILDEALGRIGRTGQIGGWTGSGRGGTGAE